MKKFNVVTFVKFWRERIELLKCEILIVYKLINSKFDNLNINNNINFNFISIQKKNFKKNFSIYL